jgi:universal stress protein A
MLDIRTILCPVDFSPLSDRTLRVATTLCQRFDARLILHHNLDSRPPGFLSVNWMWSEDHEAEEAQKAAEAPDRIQKLLGTLPTGIEAEARLTRGPLDRALIEVAKRLPADLIVMGSHGWTSAEHRSITEKLISSAPCTILTTNEGFDPETQLRPRPGKSPENLAVLVPIDLAPGSEEALVFVEAMDPMPHEVHVVHVLEDGNGDPEPRSVAARGRMLELVPESLKSRAVLDVRFGKPGDEILRLAEETEALFIVMAAHSKGLLSRFLSGDNAFEVLHGSPCPVWFVPVNWKPRLRHAESDRAAT